MEDFINRIKEKPCNIVIIGDKDKTELIKNILGYLQDINPKFLLGFDKDYELYKDIGKLTVCKIMGKEKKYLREYKEDKGVIVIKGSYELSNDNKEKLRIMQMQTVYSIFDVQYSYKIHEMYMPFIDYFIIIKSDKNKFNKKLFRKNKFENKEIIYKRNELFLW